MNTNYLGFYNGHLQASAGFSWATTGIYGPHTGHFEPLRASTDLNCPQLATWALNGPLMCICGPLRAYLDTPASNGPLMGQCGAQLASNGPVWASTGLSWAMHGLLRATWALYGHLRAPTGHMGLSWASTGLCAHLLASHGPVRATMGL